MIDREIGKKVMSLAKKFPVITITGPRQSGKTTLARSLFPGHKYITLETPDTRLMAEEDPRGFFSNAGTKIILDEVQRVPHLFSYIQEIADNSRSTGNIILTGSQNFGLMEGLSQSLAGRTAVLTLLPFTMSEAGRFPKKKYKPEEIIYKGFYPRIYDKRITPSEFYPSYIQTYVERDVRQLKNIANSAAFIRFLQLCAGRTGQLINISSLASDCGINQLTVKAWLSVLEASYIICLLQPWHANINKRMIKTPKLYFYDTGLVCSLLGISDGSQIRNHYLRGALFENLIISDVLKRFYNHFETPHCYFWREKNGREIDLIVERPGQLSAIEIKSSATYNSDFSKELLYFNKLFPKLKMDLNIIYSGTAGIRIKDVNVYGWMEMHNIPGIGP